MQTSSVRLKLHTFFLQTFTFLAIVNQPAGMANRWMVVNAMKSSERKVELIKYHQQKRKWPPKKKTAVVITIKILTFEAKHQCVTFLKWQTFRGQPEPVSAVSPKTLKSLLTLCKEDAMGSVNLYDESECCTIYLFEKNMCAHVRTALSYERS